MTSDEKVKYSVDKVMAAGDIDIGSRMPTCPLCGGSLKSMNAIEGVFRGGISGASKRHRCTSCGHMP